MLFKFQGSTSSIICFNLLPLGGVFSIAFAVLMRSTMSCGPNFPLQQYPQYFPNKIKIVGTGTNRSVAPCEPFYLLDTEWPMTDNQITGATNLIEHYGLKNAYQKYFRGNLKDELSGFLPHLSGNVNMPASADDSGLMVDQFGSLSLTTFYRA